MAYIKATTVLPKELLEEIQKYIQGESIYIPKQVNTYKKWGTTSGGRKFIDERNKTINLKFRNGKKLAELSKEFSLSEETIKKIIYTK